MRQTRPLAAIDSNSPSTRSASTKKKTPAPNLRVIKKIAPNERGAKNLTMTYGGQLVCVRHRLDTTGTMRLTTVELVISEKRIARRPGPTVDVALRPQEKELQAKLKAAGARWHKADEVWSIRRSTAIALGLKERIVPRRP
jgi:translation elongation factor EF-G